MSVGTAQATDAARLSDCTPAVHGPDPARRRGKTMGCKPFRGGCLSLPLSAAGAAPAPRPAQCSAEQETQRGLEGVQCACARSRALCNSGARREGACVPRGWLLLRAPETQFLLDHSGRMAVHLMATLRPCAWRWLGYPEPSAPRLRCNGVRVEALSISRLWAARPCIGEGVIFMKPCHAKSSPKCPSSCIRPRTGKK